MTSEKLQAEAEQLYPLPYANFAACWGSRDIAEFKRAAHVACAEKYTAIIEGHIEACNVLAKACEEKDKEIERLRSQLSLIDGELETIEFDPPTAVKRIRNHVTNALKTPTP